MAQEPKSPTKTELEQIKAVIRGFPFYGEKIELGPINHRDLSQLRHWRNQPEIMETTRTWKLLTEKNQEWFWNNVVHSDEHIVFGIYLRKPKAMDMAMVSIYTMGLIGVCRLSHINWQARSAEIGIYIGPPDERGQGYGSEALRILCRFGFLEVGLHRLVAYARADNEASNHIFQKQGFKFEGRLRDYMFRGGHWRDVMLYSLIQGEDKLC